MSDLLTEEKKFYERFWALHRDPVLVNVMKVFGYTVFHRSSVLEGFEAFLKKVNFGGAVCVEIGSYKGLTAIVLARYFDKVISVDILPDSQKREIAEFCGCHNVTFVDINDNKQKALLLEHLVFDAAYIDGDHAYDTETDFALVRQCGQVLFHEYWEAQPVVYNLVDQLRNEGSVVNEGKFALWTR